MGIHIIPKLHNGIKETSDVIGVQQYDDVQTLDNKFDSTRKLGDKEFIESIEWEYLPSCEEQQYLRPKDIDAAITLCESRLNQGRFISFLKEMKDNPNLAFFVSR